MPQASRNRKRTLWGYVEDFDELRTMSEERRVSARRGWAGEKDGFFSILLDGFIHIGRFPKATRCSSSPALPRTLFHPYQKK
jgi:hypothetical protein